jgi:hypothetical protein
MPSVSTDKHTKKAWGHKLRSSFIVLLKAVASSPFEVTVLQNPDVVWLHNTGETFPPPPLFHAAPPPVQAITTICSEDRSVTAYITVSCHVLGCHVANLLCYAAMCSVFRCSVPCL